MKPGYKTTEFWTSIFAQVMGLAVIMGAVDASSASIMTDAATQMAGAVITGAGAFGYSISRGNAKKHD